MRLKSPLGFTGREFLLVSLAILGVIVIYFWQLARFLPGISHTEKLAINTPVGWHGLYQHPLYLPIEFARSVIFKLFGTDHVLLLRTPNVLLGIAAVLAFSWIVYNWHSNRTAILASLMFLTSAWVLHSSRLASFDTLYLLAVPLMLALYINAQENPESGWWYYGSMMIWGITLYVPGLVWLVLYMMFMQRSQTKAGWASFSAWYHRLSYVLLGLILLPLLVWRLRDVATLKLWAGIPAHFGAPLDIAKQFVAVPVHLFARGPQYPEQWLGRLPILDIFTLAACIVGIYFYLTNLKAGRSRLLFGLLLLTMLLVGLHGAVSLSLVVPVLYLFVAAGIAFLMKEWLQRFPFNPLARTIGIGFILAAVGLSCLYNLRSYYIAWPHNSVTKSTFRQQP
jgi:hypothetical protein